MKYNYLIKAWKKLLKIAESNDWESENLRIGEKACENDLYNIEQKIALQIPKNFRIICEEFSKAVFVFWSSREDLDDEFENINCGTGYLWNLDNIEEIYNSYLQRLQNSKESNLCEIWKNKFPFVHIQNGDYIAIDLNSGESYGTVVYLSRNDDEFNGYRLGLTFLDFIERWTTLQCICPESENLITFYDIDNKVLFKQGKVIDKWMNLFYMGFTNSPNKNNNKNQSNCNF